MNCIKTVLISESYIDQLFQFEKENRSYFESIGLGRSAEYYDKDSFIQINYNLIDEQKQGKHYMYLVIDENGNIIGRVNLTDVIPFPLKKAELGYRMGSLFQGKGYATIAVAQVLKAAAEIHGLHRIEAGTSKENVSSQKVLNKNGFRYVGTFNQYIYQRNGWVDSLIYEKIIQE